MFVIVTRTQSLRAATLYEITPFNYGIHLPVVLGSIAGTIAVSHGKFILLFHMVESFSWIGQIYIVLILLFFTAEMSATDSININIQGE